MTSPGLVSGRRSDIDVTEVLQAFVLNNGNEDDSMAQPDSPMVVITPPSAPLMVSQRSPLLSTQAIPATPRPKLRRRASTAPPECCTCTRGLTCSPHYALLARPFQISLNRYRTAPIMTPPFSRISLFGAPTSRSLFSRRKEEQEIDG